MSRKPRLHIPSAYYHVMIRGNGGSDIFLEDVARCQFYLLMQEGVERFGHRIHAFCLMNNHVHLLIQVGDESLSRIMQNLSFRYTRWFNNKQGRIGHLFQGRFKALIVDEEHYLLELVRYIHLNPVRANMVSMPSDYAWSSHNAYLGKETLAWLESETVLSHFSSHESQAREIYAVFIASGIGEGFRPDFHRGLKDNRILGDDHFAEKVLLAESLPIAKAILDDCIKLVCDAYQLDNVALRRKGQQRQPSEARSVVAYLVQRHGKETLTDVAKYFERDVATMSTAVRRLEAKIKKDKNLQQIITNIETTLVKL